MLASSTSLPGRAINANPVRTYGPRRNNPNLSVYDDITMNFICQSEGLFPKPLFEEWQNAIVEATTARINYPDNYSSDIEIEQYDSTGEITYAIKLIDAWPIIISPMTVDWSQTNMAHNLSVSFTFRKSYEQPLTLLPFGNNLIINNLYPNFDLGGMLDEFQIASIGTDGQQVINKYEQGKVFANSIRAIFD